MARATKGGETGINGERYEGGQFLPNTLMGKMPKSSKTAGTRKVEIAPYVHEVAPEGMTSIYRQIAGIYGKVINGVFVVNTSDTTLAYYGKTRDEVDALAAKWNAGERYV